MRLCNVLCSHAQCLSVIVRPPLIRQRSVHERVLIDVDIVWLITFCIGWGRRDACRLPHLAVHPSLPPRVAKSGNRATSIVTVRLKRISRSIVILLEVSTKAGSGYRGTTRLEIFGSASGGRTNTDIGGNRGWRDH
jgi:hypothetical protein